MMSFDNPVLQEAYNNLFEPAAVDKFFRNNYEGYVRLTTDGMYHNVGCVRAQYQYPSRFSNVRKEALPAACCVVPRPSPLSLETKEEEETSSSSSSKKAKVVEEENPFLLAEEAECKKFLEAVEYFYKKLTGLLKKKEGGIGFNAKEFNDGSFTTATTGDDDDNDDDDDDDDNVEGSHVSMFTTGRKKKKCLSNAMWKAVHKINSEYYTGTDVCLRADVDEDPCGKPVAVIYLLRLKYNSI